MSNKKVLGRGLGNLLALDAQSQNAKIRAGIEDLPIKNIRANPDNPRKKFEQTSIEELSSTIKIYGLLQPILVSKINDTEYMLISGERRLRACRLLNLETVPCIVKEDSDQTKLAISLIENIQREQLDSIEEAMVYKEMLEKYNLTQEDLAQQVGKNRSTITNRIRLLQLPLELQAAVADGRLSEGQVRPIISIKNEIERQKLVTIILNQDLTARQIEELVRTYKEPTSSKNTKNIASSKEDANIKSIERILEENLNTRVKIQHNTKSNQGKIIIEYFNLEEFERIHNIIKKD